MADTRVLCSRTTSEGKQPVDDEHALIGNRLQAAADVAPQPAE